MPEQSVLFVIVIVGVQSQADIAESPSWANLIGRDRSSYPIYERRYGFQSIPLVPAMRPRPRLPTIDRVVPALENALLGTLPSQPDIDHTSRNTSRATNPQN